MVELLSHHYRRTVTTVSRSTVLQVGISLQSCFVLSFEAVHLFHLFRALNDHDHVKILKYMNNYLEAGVHAQGCVMVGV